METFAYLALGWTIGVVTVFFWATFAVMQDRKKLARAIINREAEAYKVHPLFPPKDNN